MSDIEKKLVICVISMCDNLQVISVPYDYLEVSYVNINKGLTNLIFLNFMSKKAYTIHCSFKIFVLKSLYHQYMPRPIDKISPRLLKCFFFYFSITAKFISV